MLEDRLECFGELRKAFLFKSGSLSGKRLVCLEPSLRKQSEVVSLTSRL